jgi:hypothetical protein
MDHVVFTAQKEKLSDPLPAFYGVLTLEMT